MTWIIQFITGDESFCFLIILHTVKPNNTFLVLSIKPKNAKKGFLPLSFETVKLKLNNFSLFPLGNKLYSQYSCDGHSSLLTFHQTLIHY